MELMRVGFNFQTTGDGVHLENGRAQDLIATPVDVRCWARPLRSRRAQAALPLSGFRLRSHINSNKVWDEFLVFQGASYFRARGPEQVYGLSARGLAINTAEPAGEEFPAFTHFWIERPGARRRRS